MSEIAKPPNKKITGCLILVLFFRIFSEYTLDNKYRINDT